MERRGEAVGALTLLDVPLSATWRPRGFDVVLASGLLIIGMVQIQAPDPHRVIANPSFSAVVWGLTAASLAWRRRSPWLVFAVVTLGLTLEAVPAPDSGTLAGFVALCVALYTVAREDRSLEKTVAASAIALIVLFFHYARDPMASNAVESIQATYVVLLACAVVGRLVSSRAATTEQERAAQADREAAAAGAATEAERVRIARELHDVIAHSVTVAIVQSMAAQSAIADGELDDAARRLAAIEETSRQTLADMRRLVTINDSGPNDDLGSQPGLTNLPALVQQLVDAGSDVRLDFEGPPADVSPGADLALFRIVQEALTNAVNHAPGASVHIHVRMTEESVEVEIVNGEPTRPDTGAGTGRGVVGMRERARLYNGSFESGSCTDGGFRVHASLPREATST
jgi:signal transduction histidine kinase